MIALGEFTDKHLEKTLQWMQDEKLKDSFLLDKEVTRQSHEQWFKNLNDDPSQKIFAIISDNIHIGNIGIKNIDFRNKKAESWIYIGEGDYKGKGIARSALTDLGEKVSGDVEKLYANIADNNHSSLRAFLGSGYKIEGFLHHEMLFKDKWVNLFRLYILL